MRRCYPILFWSLTLLGSAGISLYVSFVVGDLSRGLTSGGWLAWPAFCVLALIAGLAGLRVQYRRRRTSNLKAQLYTTDLLTVSVGIALYFLIIRSVSLSFFQFGIFGGLAVLLATILALLSASRNGFTRGPGRVLFALGSILRLLGAGGVATFTFFILLVLTVDSIRIGFWRCLEMVLNYSYYPPAFRGIAWAGLYGAIALAAGQVACWTAGPYRTESPSETKIDGPESPFNYSLGFFWVLWIMLALGTAGIAYETQWLCLLSQLDSNGINELAAPWCIYTLSAGALTLAIMGLHHLRRNDDEPWGSQQLYMGDLVTISFAVAAYLSVVKNLWVDEFLKFGISGSAIIIMAMVLSLLRSSRKGYPGGAARRIYAVGCLLSVIGGSCVGALFVVDLFRSNYFWFNERYYIVASQVFGGLSLLVGQSCCLLATWIRRRQESVGSESEYSLDAAQNPT